MANGTNPTTPRKDPTQAMLENIRFMRENGYPKEEIDAEIKRWAPKIAAFNAAEMQREDPLGLTQMSPTAGALKAGAKAGLEAAETVAAGFPGAQLAMAGLRSATSGIPLEEAKRQIQQEVSDQGAASAVGRMAGGLPMLAAGGAIAGRAPQALRGALQAAGQAPYVGRVARAVAPGAAMGATEQVLSGDPAATGNRLARAKQGAFIGGVMTPIVGGASRVGFGVRDLSRALRTPSRAAQQIAAEAERAAVTGPMFAAAQQAGRVNLPAGLRTGVLQDPELAPYISDVMSSPSFKAAYPNPSEQDIIKATREHILDVAQKAEQAATTQATGGLQRVQAGTRMAKADAENLANRLLAASDITTGGKYRAAVREYARRSEDLRTRQEAADAARAVISGKWTPGKKLTTQSPEAFVQRVGGMSQQEAQSVLPMARAALAESTNLSYSPISGFGIPRAIQRTLGARKVLGPLEEAAAGKPLMQPKTLRDLILAAGTGF